MARLFVGLPLLKLHCNWRGNWPVLVLCGLRKDRQNVTGLMDVDRLMLLTGFGVHAKTEGDIPEIMHPECLLHLVLDLPNQALVSNGEEMFDLQNDCGNNHVRILIMEHEQSSVDT